MEAESSEGAGDGDPVGQGSTVAPRQNPNLPIQQVKSCKGCLYYSSARKDKSGNPICVGITRTLKEVPGYVVGESEREAAKNGRILLDFKYACAGYSLFLNSKDNPGDKREDQAALPICAGIELLVDRRPSAASHAPAHVHNKEDGTVRSEPRTQKLTRPAKEDEFLSRFRRSAGLVASGVSKNVHKVGHYIKDSLDDIMYPYRRRPK